MIAAELIFIIIWGAAMLAPLFTKDKDTTL